MKKRAEELGIEFVCFQLEHTQFKPGSFIYNFHYNNLYAFSCISLNIQTNEIEIAFRHQKLTIYHYTYSFLFGTTTLSEVLPQKIQ